MNNNTLYKRILDNRKAFTMIELLVSIAIIVIITSVFLANYRTGNEKSKMNIVAHSFASDIRRAQNNSLGLIKYAGEAPSGGWGININLSSNNASYRIFADIDANRVFDAGEDAENYGGSAITLPDGITFEYLDIVNSNNEGGGNDRQEINITFLPPDPITYIHDGIDEHSNVWIGLVSDKGDQKQIHINFLGLIDITR